MDNWQTEQQKDLEERERITVEYIEEARHAISGKHGDEVAKHLYAETGARPWMKSTQD
ncbi:MAG: hypothetical protein MJA83_10250 [Gammaproteobacteria bacterium]|nr:hypothetical protein [Gammaproteobacteria bacterium]